MSKKVNFKMIGLVAALAASAGGAAFYMLQEEPAPPPMPKPKPVVKVEEPKDLGPLKVAFAYVGPVGDGGWSYAHDMGRKAVEKEFGDKVITSFVESIPENQEAEKAIDELATQGNKIIFGTTFGYSEALLKNAMVHQNIKFFHATGSKTANNLTTYDSKTYEGAYMAGVIAGKMTKSNTLGIVASIPITEVIRNINSYTLGAQSVNPKIKTKVIWVNEWFNPPKEAEAATALIKSGADILFQNTDSPAVLKTAQDMGKRAFGWDSDMTAYGPKAHLASSVINWGPYYVNAVKSTIEKKDMPAQSWWGVKEGTIDLVSIAEDVPVETKSKVDEIRNGLKDGSFSIWKGPILDNKGNEVLKNGDIATDKFLGGINFFVQGVEGDIPKFN